MTAPNRLNKLADRDEQAEGHVAGVAGPPWVELARGMLFLNCPRCGLTITPRAAWLSVRHCPRCLARSRTAVELFSSRLPAKALYASGAAPRPDGLG
jgi:hypothetical protein